jgi:ribosomal protein S18 acetylase RimI-like enzyme
MSSLIVETPLTGWEVVDLSSIHPREMEHFWTKEVQIWRERLHWDVSGAVSALARAMERGGLQGKAVRIGTFTAAYAYYLIEDKRGVISGLVVSNELAEFDAREVGKLILGAVMHELRRRGVRRIESQVISFDAPWLVDCFEGEGCLTRWREFMRISVSRSPSVGETLNSVNILPWKSWNLSEAAHVMQVAHEGGIDARMNELYRTRQGCRVLLNNILRQRGCGTALMDASGIARDRRTDRLVGFTVVTEVAKRQGHLAQIAVLPELQGTGVGRALLDYSIAKMASSGYETLTLMVSLGNDRAQKLYEALGFTPIFRFPVFSWER